MFADTLLESTDEHRRQRLSFAALLTLASTAAALASLATFERFAIDRVGGPEARIEVAAFSLTAAPERFDPPAAPPVPERASLASAGEPAPEPERRERAAPRDSGAGASSPSSAGDSEAQPDPLARFGGRLGCPPGMRCADGSASTFTTGPGSGPGEACVGPSCVRPPAPELAAAPQELELDALRCLACADPDQLALRKLAAGVGHRRGRVELRFCVDTNGRVERSSLRVARSFGVASVDRVAAAAVEGWRFSPVKVGGEARRACSRARFDIRFD